MTFFEVHIYMYLYTIIRLQRNLYVHFETTKSTVYLKCR